MSDMMTDRSWDDHLTLGMHQCGSLHAQRTIFQYYTCLLYPETWLCVIVHLPLCFIMVLLCLSTSYCLQPQMT